jgi:hypothetical protein
MNVTLRMTEAHHRELQDHLFPGDGKEAVALLVCGRRNGEELQALTVQRVVPVPYDECSVREPDRVVWSTNIIDRLIPEVWKKGLSVVKIHSHPGGYDQFSVFDDESDRALSLAWDGLFEEGRLHGSAVMLPCGRLFGRTLVGGEFGKPFRAIMAVGHDIRLWLAQRQESLGDQDLRNLQAFGEGTIQILKNLRVAVIGCSGTGSVLIELLARLGVGEFVFVDPDWVEDKNLNRILNSTSIDAKDKLPKVLLMKRMVDSLGRGQKVLPLQMNLDTVEAVHRVAECDVIFGCVDSAEGRNLANRIAAYYLLPYIDVGVSLTADGQGGVSTVAGAVNFYRPGGATLFERGAYTMEQVRAEELKRTNPEQYAELRRQKYIQGVNEDRPAVISVNTFFASLAVNEFLARIHLFRNIENEEFSTVRGDLCEFALMREPEVESYGHLQKELGLGDRTPLLGRPGLG